MMSSKGGVVLTKWLLAVGFGCGLTGCDRPADSTAPSKPVAAETVAAAPSATNAPVNKAALDIQKLKGRWLRPDGGYVIEIRQVDANGQLDAGYFNPNPIRVVSSVAKLDGAALKVHVELNDVNYPGCTYDLTYIPEADLMVGTYFQAALQQTFDVAFQRMK